MDAYYRQSFDRQVCRVSERPTKFDGTAKTLGLTPPQTAPTKAAMLAWAARQSDSLKHQAALVGRHSPRNNPKGLAK